MTRKEFEKVYNVFMWTVRIAAIIILLNTLGIKNCQNKNSLKQKAVITNNQKTR